MTERKVSIDEWREGAASGRIREVFACGTAAVITPVASLKWNGGEVQVADGNGGPVTSRRPRPPCSTSSTVAPPTRTAG